MKFPQVVPEIPVQSVDAGVDYYITRLGFTLDWSDDASGIAGISKGNCRLYLTNGTFRTQRSNSSPVVIWVNLESKAEVDELFSEWMASKATVLAEPDDKPWNLREFLVSDLDGNILRVFYDFSGD